MPNSKPRLNDGTEAAATHLVYCVIAHCIAVGSGLEVPVERPALNPAEDNWPQHQ
jgi:hypothetical protein